MFSILLNDYMNGWAVWLEEMIALRMTLLISYIIYFSEPLQAWFNFAFLTKWTLIEYVLFPIIYTYRTLKGILIIFCELILPLYTLVILIFWSIW